MPTAPVISFLLCTRNRATIAHECVQRLLESPRQDFEVIVRDNCSTDNTLELLRAIRDDRLSIHVAPENQGTRTFYEVSKLASGEIVTWLSDEDDFQFAELDYVVDRFKRDSGCDVLFGGIVVGSEARRVIFPEGTITDIPQACITALSFSGCGGLFVRRAALWRANSFRVDNMDDAYALWNYYPVGFFASRGVRRSLATTSRVVVIQSRFARTTNNWSKVATSHQVRVPHYYPESVFDRLVSNIVNVLSKPLSLTSKLRTTFRLVRMFRSQIPSFSDPAVHQLLRENYPEEVVSGYLAHVRNLGLDTAAGGQLWFVRKLVSLPLRLAATRDRWRQLSGMPVDTA